MNLTFDLTGKTAVVTGGGGVLCSGFSKTLSAAGARVAVCDLRPEAAQAVADDITAAGGCAIAVEMNVLDKSSVEAARDKIYAAFGVTAIDLLTTGRAATTRRAPPRATSSPPKRSPPSTRTGRSKA